MKRSLVALSASMFLATAPALAEAPTPAPMAEPAPPKVVVTSVQLAVNAANPTEAVASMLGLVEAERGYLLRQSDQRVVVRIPAERIDAVLVRLERMGRAGARSVEQHDVTETLQDLRVRLESSRGFAERLTAVLAEATRIEDAIAVETRLLELAEAIVEHERNVEELEERVSFATLEVHWNAPVEAAVTLALDLPFAWLGTLGWHRLAEGKAP